MSISGDAGIIDPAIFAIVLPEPVLHSKIFTGVKVTGVKLYAAVKIGAMDTGRSTTANFLRHATAGECQPRPVEPNTAFVFARDPNHYRSGIHYLAKTHIEAAWWFGW